MHKLRVQVPLVVVAVLALFGGLAQKAVAYPPAVGILGKSKNCLACHVNNGPWKDDERTIVDILDQGTRKSLRQPDETFLVEARRGEARTLLTVIGRSGFDKAEDAPYRNAWLYIDPGSIGTSSLSKFAPGWEVDLPMACRIVGDMLDDFHYARITVLPMTIRPTDAARDTTLSLQVMLTRGESLKGQPERGMVGSFFERRVTLKVKD